MRTDIPSSLQSHLDTRETTTCYCWRIDRTDGNTLGFTDHDRDLTFDSITYEASSGAFASSLEKKSDMSIDNLEFLGAVTSDAITKADIEKNLYDGAEVSLFLVNWEDVSERFLIQKGIVGNITYGELQYTAELRGMSYELQQTKGRMYSRTCDAVFGDPRCGINSAAYTATGSVTGGESYLNFYTGSLGSYANNYFTRGKITFTSGLNSGVVREVRSDGLSGSYHYISLWESLPYDLSVGDTFSIVAGCNKEYSICKSKFGNGNNFRGFPYIPSTNVIYEVAKKSKSGKYDGQSLFR